MKKKTDELVEELKEALEDHKIKPIELARQVGKSVQIVYRWLNGTARPRAKRRDDILQLIVLLRTGEFIENSDIEVKSGFTGSLEEAILNEAIFAKLKPSLTSEQKVWLLETGNYFVYHKRLKELNERHRKEKSAK